MEFESEKIISKFNKGTIVLVHGAYHGPWCWEDNFKPFFVKRGYSVIVVNFSNPNPKVKINDYMEHLNEVVGEISGKVYIISHSLGTAIVEKYITKFSPKLDAVVFLAPSPVIKRLQKAFLVNFHNIMRSKSCFYFSNRLDESVESVYLDKFTDESRQIELLMIRKKVPVGYEWNYKTLVMGSLNDNCMPISVLLDTAKIFKAKLIIYQEHCHDMMLDPAWEIVAEDILGFILV